MFHLLRVLLISSEARIATLVSSVLEAEGHRVTLIATPQMALAHLRSEAPYDAALLDPSTPRCKLSSLEALTIACGAERLWLLEPLGMNLWKEDAARLGIHNILPRPLQRHDLDKMIVTLHHLGPPSSAPLTPPAPYSPSPDSLYLEEMPRGRYFLAACPSMKKIYNTVRLLAPVDVPVLILGESGVGKDIVANLLHKHSMRAQESYVSVNCAALPSELLESELFGYETGAFTGAIKAKPGQFEMANRGTLLLDEIGEMSAPMQAKLLHVLQDGRFSRLGSRASTEVDVRIMAATNVDIDAAIADSSIREDLYYRISAFTIVIPPLRDRREEIPFLVEEMLRRHGANLHQQPAHIFPSLLEAMQEYDWPGNLRELSNFVIRILILQDQDAILADLAAKIRSRGCAPANGRARANEQALDGMRQIVRNCKDQTESRLIQDALDAAGWNRRHAAAQLQISYRGLLYKIQQYQLRETNPHLRTRVR
ncbi:MAG TPA: sigma-54 dependent transcriptional regulator [Granulicella sp.]|jgi:two-component system response regulator AtoC|nr:sigma-54 dependent transcriptional regulator [Granulicella sp.]